MRLTNHQAGPDRHLGGCCLGGKVLREIRFQVSPLEKDRLLKKYWSVPQRQVETSVVLAQAKNISTVRRSPGY